MLTFIYSTVNAGKTANLLMRSHSCSERNINFIIFVPEVASQRDGRNTVSSRIGFKQDAISLTPECDPHSILVENIVFKNDRSLVNVVFVDESQFLTKKQILSLNNIVVDLNIPVFAYGLRTDFKGEPFEGSTYLMAWADNIEEIVTDAPGNKKALFNMKTDDTGVRVTEGNSIDAGFHYSPVDRATFNLNKFLKD